MRVSTGMRYWNLKILVSPVNLTNCYKMVTTLRVQALFPTLDRRPCIYNTVAIKIS